jgi:hypothetical protein
MAIDERDGRGFPKRWTGLAATGTNQATAFVLLDGGYHEFTTVGSGTGAVLPVVMPWSREITISNNGANALLIYPPSGGTIDTAGSSVSLAAGSSATYWATSPTNWQDRVTGGSGGGGGGGSTTITEVSQTASFTAAANSFYAISGSANVTATLPTAVGIAGQTIRVRCVSGYTGLCTITGTGGQTIGSQASRIIFAGESPLLQSDGSNWIRAGGLIIPATCIINPSGAQSLLGGSVTTIAYDTIVYDNTGKMVNVTSHNIKTLRPGQYMVSSSSYFDQLSPTEEHQINMEVYQNGLPSGLTFRILTPIATGSLQSDFSLLCHGSLTCASGAIFTSVLTHNSASGGAITLYQGPYSYLTVTEIPQW